jgi:hypothetical protein
MRDPRAPEAWFRDRAAWSLIGKRYLPWLAALNLAWELAQLPLYTIWRDASAGYVALAVAHCTVGDLLIGTAALAITLVAMRAGPLETWRWISIAAGITVLGAGYTIASEWMNTSLRQSWEYSQAMPVIDVQGVSIGLSPLAQWLVVPPLALLLARRSSAR